MIRHRAFALSAIIAIVFTLIGGTGQVSAAATSAASNVTGNSYTSPNFGYSINWDSTWQVTDEQTKPEGDKLTLDNGVSTVYLDAVNSTHTPDECVAAIVKMIMADATNSNVVPFKDDKGLEISDSTASRSLAVYQFDHSSKGTSTQFALYIECRQIEAGASMLVIRDLVVADKFVSESDAMVKLLNSLVNHAGATTGGNDTSGGGNSTGNASNGGNAVNKDDLTAFISRTLVDIDAFWAREFPVISRNGAYAPPAKLVTFDAAIDTGCGPVKASDVGQIGPFYCPGDNIIYYDLKDAERDLKRFDNNRSVISVAVAHEMGHHIQALAGWKQCTETPCLDPQEMTSQELELQADCFAGAWTADAEGRGRLGSFDVETNIAEFAIFLGDKQGKAVTADAQVHGNGALRTYWFLSGYYKRATDCLTASAATDPARNGAGVSATPTAGNSSDPGATTPAATATAGNTGASLAIGDKFEVALGSGTASAVITGSDAKDQVLVVYFNITTGAQGGAFDYATFTVTDSAGKTSNANVAATDKMLKTSPDFPDGTAQALDPNMTYELAVMFNVPKGAAGFTLATADGSVSVTLDR